MLHYRVRGRGGRPIGRLLSISRPEDRLFAAHEPKGIVPC